MHYIVVNDSLIIKFVFKKYEFAIFVNLIIHFRNIFLTNYMYSQCFTTIELKNKFLRRGERWGERLKNKKGKIKRGENDSKKCREKKWGERKKIRGYRDLKLIKI